MEFNRKINTHFELVDNTKILSEGCFLDDYHDIKCSLMFSLPSLEIIDTKIEMGKLPQEICKIPLDKVHELKGLKVERGFRQKVKRIVGGKEGCIHISDLIHEMAQGIVALLRKAHLIQNVFPSDTFYGECIGLKKEMNC